MFNKELKQEITKLKELCLQKDVTIAKLKDDLLKSLEERLKYVKKMTLLVDPINK